MSRILMLASAAVVLAACGSTSPSSGTKLYTSADGETVECRRIQEMGSRLGKRVCMKPAEWEQADAAAEEAAKSQIDRNNQRGVATDAGAGGIGG